jgi:PTS system nitrogen regulatory IIA component
MALYGRAIMPHRTFNVDEVAGYLHVERRHIERLAREREIPFALRGGRMVFQRGEIDAWASQRLLGLPDQGIEWYHRKTWPGARQAFPEGALVPALLRPEYIELALPAKTKASVIRAMVALAERTGRVLDPRGLLASLEERQALSSTALPGGLALLHARQQQPYLYEGSFIVLGRTVQAVPFGAPDGRGTRVFFMICCEDEHIHLHTLARLCLLALRTDVIQQLIDAARPAEAYHALIAAEKSVLPGGVNSGKAAPA